MARGLRGGDGRWAPFFPSDLVAAGHGDRRGLGPAGIEAAGEQRSGEHAAEKLLARLAVRLAEAAVGPRPHRHEHEAEGNKEQSVVIVLRLAGEHPEQPADRRVEREGHELLEGLHPRAGSRQQLDGLRENREQQVRQGETDRDGGENQDRLPRGQRQRGAERGREKRGAAWRGDERRERAGEERTHEAVLHLQVTPDAGGGQADLEQSAHVEREDQQEHRHAEHKCR